MAVSLKPRPASLESALGFKAVDLAANREGRLGPTQLRAARVYASVWGAMGVLFLVAMVVAFFAQLNRSDHGVADLVAPFVFALIVCGVCFLFAYMTLDTRSSKTKVTRLTGAIKPSDKAPWWYAGDTAFRGPTAGASNWSNPFGKLVKDAGVCHVYVADRTAVSIERVE
jgi:hypothetical protein